MPRPLGWLRARMGVRAVSALSAAVVVALALVVAGAALVLLVQLSLRQQVQADAKAQAQVIATRLEGNWRGEANENAREALDALIRQSDLAQVRVEYGGDGDDDDPPTWTTEAGTDAVGRDVLMSDIRPADGQTVVETGVPVRKVDGSVVDTVLVATATDSDGRDVILLFAAPLTAVETATRALLFYLLWGVPLLIVVAGVTTYLFSGRALRPVEAMRAQVSAMTEKDLEQRVPVPPARDEVGRLAETMNGMLARLQDAQGVQRRFVADASHELRSPLATIATGLELMQNGTVDRSTITALRGETARLNNLVEGLILLARADERGLRPRREEVDLDEVAELERGRPADGAVVAEVRAVPVRVVGDRGQLARVVRNLVDNARRHARSRVLVTVGRDGDTAVLEVSDDGPGVPHSERARVFERFVRLDDARARADGGSGLGLAIVAEVVAAHGGSVEVTDGPDGGALFRVRIPAAATPEAPAEEPGPAENAAPGRPAAPGPAPAAVPVPPPTRRTASANGWFAAPTPSPDAAWGDAAWTGEAAWREGPAPRPYPTRPGPAQQPVRDEEARRDPVTSPSGIPVVPADERARERVNGTAKARRDERAPAPRPGRIPAPRPQPGSAIR
ncbi:sensor histidine kinase [Pseudonocardia adelaidensis]|uniref:histidine kinase n=1 Tax=Pseudonocardia adelaidensis TaxID=648754 RepID=A0ABP9NJ55_9PSEU